MNKIFSLDWIIACVKSRIRKRIKGGGGGGAAAEKEDLHKKTRISSKGVENFQQNSRLKTQVSLCVVFFKLLGAKLLDNFI